MCLWARHNQNTKEGLSGGEGSEAVAKNRAFFFLFVGGRWDEKQHESIAADEEIQVRQ